MKRILIVATLATLSSVAAAQPVAVTLTQWKVLPSRDTVNAGAVTFRIKNSGEMTHSLYVLGEGVAKGSREIPAGQEATLTVTLKAGTYELYCPLSDLSHKMAGMKRSLVVLPAAAPAAPAKKPGA